MTEIFGLPQFGKSDTWKQVKQLNKFVMNYEKAYKDALERAKEALLTSTAYQMYVIHNIFPELIEDEDERTREEILNVFKQLDEGTTICGRNYDYAKWIAWLEKQGHMLDPDKVIEWLKAKVYDDSTYGKAMIDKFKKDFGLWNDKMN